MGTITFGGLATGLDTNSIISGLVGLERQPITAMQTSQANIRKQISLLQSLQSRVADLKSAADGFSTEDSLYALKGTSSDSTKVGVSVDSTANVGSYAISDVTLATAQKNMSAQFAGRTSPVGTGVFSITQGGTRYDMTIASADNSVEGLAAVINSKAGLGVKASLFFDGSTYRLMLQSDKTGSGAAFTVDETGLTGGGHLGFFDAGNSLSAAANATFKVDGVPATSASNTVTGVLPGVTLNLNQAFTGVPQTITVSRDVDGMVSKIQGLVDNYNSASSGIRSQFTVTDTSKPPDTKTTLFGDSTLRGLQAALSTAIGTRVAGLPDGKASLADIGITLDKTGKLTIDQTVLRKALTDDPRSVSKILAKSGGGGVATTVSATLNTYLDTTSGLLGAKQASMNARIKDLDDRIAAADRRATDYETQLRQQYTALEQTVSKLQSQGQFITSSLISK